MCSFSFTVFMSAFQLLPTAPFHILSLGGSATEAGLFLGFLIYASAVSAPITGAIGDRLGRRRVLIVASLAITAFSLLYAVAPSYHVVLALVLVHGVFWSGLLSSSSAYVIDIVPASRRAEGLGYAGFAIIATRPFVARYADRVGHARVIVPCLAMMVLGMMVLVFASTRTTFLISAVLFGIGFGSAYPIFVAHLMHHVADHRRGATFGALIGAFDTGIGTGSIAVGWMGEHYGFSRAFGVAGALALLSIPYFLYMEKRQWTTYASARQA